VDPSARFLRLGWILSVLRFGHDAFEIPISEQDSATPNHDGKRLHVPLQRDRLRVPWTDPGLPGKVGRTEEARAAAIRAFQLDGLAWRRSKPIESPFLRTDRTPSVAGHRPRISATQRRSVPTGQLSGSIHPDLHRWRVTVPDADDFEQLLKKRT